MSRRKAKIIAIAQQKGGTGKTTSVHAIGAGLTKQGHKVLFIDLDGQKNLTYSLKALNHPGATAAEVLTQGATAAEAITTTQDGDLIPASDKLALCNLDGDRWQYRLLDALEPIKPNYDYIIIDTPPQLGQILAVTLTASNLVIIPTLADFYSLQGVNQICETITQARTINAGLKIAGVLITKYTPRKVLSRDTAELLEQVARKYHTKVFATKIRECIALAEAAATQTNIFDYSGKCPGANDYNELIKELTK